MSTVPWIPGNILGSEKAYLENPRINFGTGIPWKKVSGRFNYLNSLDKFVVVVVVALADGCSFPEVDRTFHESTQKLWLKVYPSGFEPATFRRQLNALTNLQMFPSWFLSLVQVLSPRVLDRRGVGCTCLWVWALLSHLALTYCQRIFILSYKFCACGVACFLLLFKFVNWQHCLIKCCFFLKQMNFNVPWTENVISSNT